MPTDSNNLNSHNATEKVSFFLFLFLKEYDFNKNKINIQTVIENNILQHKNMIKTLI